MTTEIIIALYRGNTLPPKGFDAKHDVAQAREVPIDVVAARQLAIRRRHGTAPPKDSPWANDVCMSGVNVLAKRSSGSVWRSC
jgi:hypothetical protein